MTAIPICIVSGIPFRVAQLTCWCSAGNDLPGVGNEPRDSRKEKHKRRFVGVIPTHSLPIEPASKVGFALQSPKDQRGKVRRCLGFWRTFLRLWLYGCVR